MIIFGKRNYDELIRTISFMGAITHTKKYKLLPIYKVCIIPRTPCEIIERSDSK